MYIYGTVKSDGENLDGARSRNNSAICVIVRNPNAGERVRIMRGRADITTDMRSLNLGQEW